MTQTTTLNMIVPEVWGDMMQAEFVGRTVFGQEGGFVKVDDTLEGQPGEKITLPKWTKLGLDDTLDTLTETVAIVPDVLDTDQSNTATIKEAGKGAEVTDRALLVGYGDPLAEVRRQFGQQTVRTVDGDLRAAFEASATKTFDGSAGSFSAFTVADALGEFGDDADPGEFAGIVIHSKQRTAAFKDDNFISADKYGPNAVILRGQIGDVYGVPVVVSDRTTVVVDGGGVGVNHYKALLIKRESGLLLYKRRPVVEQDRDILARSTVVTTNVHYAAGVADTDGVCVVTTKA